MTFLKTFLENRRRYQQLKLEREFLNMPPHLRADIGLPPFAAEERPHPRNPVLW